MYIIFKKKSSKKNQNPSWYYNYGTNLEFQHKPKYQSFKNPHIKIDLILWPRGFEAPTILARDLLEFVGASLSGLEMGACSLEAATTTKQ
jgi:hypothetical protein